MKYLRLGTILVVEPPENVLLDVDIEAVRGDYFALGLAMTQHTDCTVVSARQSR